MRASRSARRSAITVPLSRRTFPADGEVRRRVPDRAGRGDRRLRRAVLAPSERVCRRRDAARAGGGGQLARVLNAPSRRLSPRARNTPSRRGRPDVFTAGKLDLLRAVRRDARLRQPAELLRRDARAHRQAAHRRGHLPRLCDGARVRVRRQPRPHRGADGGERGGVLSRAWTAAVALAPENITVHTLCLKKGARNSKRRSSFLAAAKAWSEMLAYARGEAVRGGVCAVLPVPPEVHGGQLREHGLVPSGQGVRVQRGRDGGDLRQPRLRRERGHQKAVRAAARGSSASARPRTSRPISPRQGESRGEKKRELLFGGCGIRVRRKTALKYAESGASKQFTIWRRYGKLITVR